MFSLSDVNQLFCISFFLFPFLFALYLAFTHVQQYLSLSQAPSTLVSQADCFLIGGVPEVVVVMVTCKGPLEGLDDGSCGGWVRVGRGTHSRKPRAALIQGLGGHFRKWTLCACVCV